MYTVRSSNSALKQRTCPSYLQRSTDHYGFTLTGLYFHTCVHRYIMSASATFAQLRALRAAGKKRLDSYQVQDQGDIYDEVGEEDYKKVVRSRLNQDDFVIDDNGEGYADDGREEWQNERRDYSSDEEVPLKGKAAKRKREEDKEKDEKENHKIMNYFNKGPATATATASKPKVPPA